MAAIAASNVTYAINKTKKLEDNRLIVEATISFGNGVLTYPVGGVPLLLGSLGMSRYIDDLVINDSGQSAYWQDYDGAGVDIRMYNTAAGLKAELSGTAVALQTYQVTVIGR